MVILLKALAFIIWMVLMAAVVVGGRYGAAHDCREVSLDLTNDESLELNVIFTLRRLKAQDRLIIYDYSPTQEKSRQVLIKGLMRRNPSIAYWCAGSSYI